MKCPVTVVLVFVLVGVSGQGESVGGEAEDVVRGSAFGVDGASATQEEAAQMLGVCAAARTFRRWSARYEEDGSSRAA